MKLFHILTFLFGVLQVTISFAENHPWVAGDQTGHSTISAGTKIIKNAFSSGTLIGGTYQHFESESFSIGGTAYTGQLSTGAIGNFSYGGFFVGFHEFQHSRVQLEINFLMGGGGGVSDQGVGGGAVLEPSAGINLVVGKKTRLSLQGGYTWIPSSTQFSGANFGIRVDFLHY